MKKNLYIFLIILFAQNVSAQNNNIYLFFETVIDTGKLKPINFSNFPTVILTKEEKKLLANHFLRTTNDSLRFYFSEIEGLDQITSLKKTKKLIKTNDGYLYFKSKPSLYEINNDSVSYYMQVLKLDKEGNQLYDIETGDEIFIEKLITESLIDIITSIRTHETWRYENNKFIKKTNFISLTKERFDYNEHLIGTKNFLTNLVQNKSKYSNNNLLKKNVSYEFYFSNNYKKNILEKNSYFNNYTKTYNDDFENIEEKSLLISLIEDVYANKLKIYALNNNKITSKELDTLFSYQTIIYKYDKTGETIKNQSTTHYISYKISDIIGINFTEDWYLASNQFDIIKEVKSISFLVNDYNEKGEIIGIKKLPCIIKFNN